MVECWPSGLAFILVARSPGRRCGPSLRGGAADRYLRVGRRRHSSGTDIGCSFTPVPMHNESGYTPRRHGGQHLARGLSDVGSAALRARVCHYLLRMVVCLTVKTTIVS